MGFSILWIYFYHYQGLQLGGIIGRIVDALFSVGWIGVDIFLFLSAIGCCYSLKKDPNTIQFYKRRVFRIIPTWWLFLTLFLVVANIRKSDCPESISDLILYFSGIGWWVNGLFDVPRQVYYEWYVPTLLLFYITMPLLYKRNSRTLLCLYLASSLLSLTLSYFDIFPYIYCSYQRIPIFILGVLFGKWMTTGKAEDKKCSMLTMFLLLGLMSFMVVWLNNPFHRHMNLALLRFSVTMFLPIFCVITGRFIEFARLSKPLCYMGGGNIRVVYAAYL